MSDGRRHVVISTTYYWPETTGNAPYATGFAEHLAARGDRVTVLTGFPHYPEWRSTSGKRLGATEERNGVEIKRRWHYVPGRQSAARRGLYELSVAAAGWTSVGPWSRPDAVVAIVPTLAAGAIGLYASRINRAPLGLVFQDLMGPGARQNGVRGGECIGSVLGKAEMQLARRASGVAVITEGFRDYLADGGIERDRVRVLRNWVHAGVPTETREVARERLGWQRDEFICLHSGNMGQKQGLDNLLDAAARLQAMGEARVRVVLAGDGNDRARLGDRANAMGLANVSFVGLQPDGQYEAMLGAADLLVAHQRATVTNAALPSKLTSYFHAGRPVLAVAAPDSQTASELRHAKAGPVVAPGDPDALANAISNLVRSPGQLEVFGAHAREYAACELHPSRALERYERFVDELTEVA